MAIEEKVQSNEEKQAVASDLNKRGTDLAQSIIKTLDLPTSIAEAVDGEQTRRDLEENPKDGESDSSGETSAETSDESEGTTSEQTQESDEPKQDSVQKRIDELTREKKQLEARLKKLEARHEPQESKDPDLEKLQKMSVDELKETRKKVLKAQRTADEATLDQLFDLEEKVNKAIESAPVRFQSQQVERFNEVLASTTDLSDKELEVVFGHAKNIFSRTPSFQSSIDGQAEAWQLAVEHYREMNKLTVGKSKVNELERKVNELKKKTSLDSAVQKGNSKISDEAKMFNRARNGSESDKEAFIRKRLNTDALVPEEFRRN